MINILSLKFGDVVEVETEVQSNRTMYVGYITDVDIGVIEMSNMRDGWDGWAVWKKIKVSDIKSIKVFVLNKTEDDVDVGEDDQCVPNSLFDPKLCHPDDEERYAYSHMPEPREFRYEIWDEIIKELGLNCKADLPEVLNAVQSMKGSWNSSPPIKKTNEGLMDYPDEDYEGDLCQST